MKIAVQAQLGKIACSFETRLNILEKVVTYTVVCRLEFRGNEFVIEQKIHRLITERINVEMRPVNKWLDLAQEVDTRNQPADLPLQRLVIQVRRPTATTRAYG